jgi:Ca-activated chloride channel family protein
MRELLSVYLDGQLSQQEKIEVDVHLNECNDCKKYYAQLQSLRKMLSKYAQEELSPDSEQKIKNDFLGGKLKRETIMKNKILVSVGSVALMVVLVFAFAVKTNVVKGTRVMIPVDIKGATKAPVPVVKPIAKVTPKVIIAPVTPVAVPADKEALQTEALRAKGTRMLQEATQSSQVQVDRRISYSQSNSASIGYAGAVLGDKSGVWASHDGTGSFGARLKDSSDRIDGESARITTVNLGAASYGINAKSYQAFYREAGWCPDPVWYPHRCWDWPDEPLIYVVQHQDVNSESYNPIIEQDFLRSTEHPLSTFSIDVDTASYANVRRFLIDERRMPPKDAVRIEELVNYFTYDYPQPKENVPFSVTIEVNNCPWNSVNKLALIGLQGKSENMEALPPSNLVFLVDVSGSMGEPNKLDLIKQAFPMLVKNLRPQDHVSIVTFSDNPTVVLDAASGANKEVINGMIAGLVADGSTAGAAGIKAAYGIALKNLIPHGNNRVILATDGDFNVGPSEDSELVRMIEEYRNDGVFLTVLGFGTGNLKDSKLVQIADKGNGNFSYIDNVLEAKKALVSQMAGTLFTIAKDVKIQVEFNPAKVKAYRLIGYEKRALNKEDFNDDKKDAGELGAGHSVTALYELEMEDTPGSGRVDELKYQPQPVKVIGNSQELMTVKLRYKLPQENESRLITQAVAKIDNEPSLNFNFASSIAEFGMLLRESLSKGQATYDDVIARAKTAKGNDDDGYRAEFIRMVEAAQILSGK